MAKANKQISSENLIDQTSSIEGKPADKTSVQTETL